MTSKKKGAKKPQPQKARKRPAKRLLKLMVIPEPEPNTRSVLVYTGPGTVVMSGEGNVTMECGNCGAPLIVGVPVGNLQNLVFRCNKCGAFNETMA